TSKNNIQHSTINNSVAATEATATGAAKRKVTALGDPHESGMHFKTLFLKIHFKH
ncbi:hypothetical protein M5D96_012744, partial [Drosophila gunungcola]